MSYCIYHDADFEHGLRCMDCDHLFVDGEAFAERLEAFQDDIPIVELVCVPCGMKLAA